MPGQGRKGILQPEATVLCTSCNSRPAGDSGVPGICSTCVIMKKRGLTPQPDPLRPGHTPPPPRTPGYDKKPQVAPAPPADDKEKPPQK